MPPRFLERIANSDGVLQKAVTAIKAGAGLTVRYVAETLQGTSENPGSVTGYLEIAPEPGSNAASYLKGEDNGRLTIGRYDLNEDGSGLTALFVKNSDASGSNFSLSDDQCIITPALSIGDAAGSALGPKALDLPTWSTSITDPASGFARIRYDGSTLSVRDSSGVAVPLTTTRLDLPPSSAPSAPASGVVLYVDSGTSRLTQKNAAGFVSAIPRTIYGEMYLNAGSGSQSLTTGGTYYKITQWDTAGLSSGVTVSTMDSTLTATAADVYQVFASISFGGSNSTTYTFAIYVNNVADPGSACQAKLNSNGDEKEVTLTGLFALAVNDVVDVRVTADANTKTFAMTYGNFHMHGI